MLKKIQIKKYDSKQIGIVNLQVKARVYYVRSKMISKDIYQIIRNTNIFKIKDIDRFYLKFNITLSNPEIEKLHKITKFSNLTLIKILKGKIPLYLNYTFRITPYLCKQYLVVTVHNEYNKVHIDIIYVLMTSKFNYFITYKYNSLFCIGKSKQLYQHDLYWVIIVANIELDSFSIHADFKSTLINTLRSQFKNNTRYSYLFYFVQILVKYLKNISINKKIIKKIMKLNCIQILIVVLKDKIKVKGMPHV